MPRTKPKKVQRVVLSLPFMVLMVGLVVLVAISTINMYQTSRDTEETVDQLREERDELAEREDAVVDAAASLSTQRGLEEEIREKFSVVKEGERVIVLVDDPDDSAATSTEERAWWRSALDFIWPF